MAKTSKKKLNSSVPTGHQIIVPGELVFAKFAASAKFWPGITFKGSEYGRSPANCEECWIYWFGDGKVSLVPRQHIKPFFDFASIVLNNKTKLFQKAILEALQLAANRSMLKGLSETKLMLWAKDNFPNASFAPDSDKPLPCYVTEKLEMYKYNMEATKRKSSEESSSNCKGSQLNVPVKRFCKKEFTKRYGMFLEEALLNELMAFAEEELRGKIDNSSIQQSTAQTYTNASSRKEVTDFSSHKLLIDESPGQLVWAKYLCKWYPAIIIRGSDCGRKPAVKDKIWVFWCGEHLISLISKEDIVDYIANFNHHIKAFSKTKSEAIKESLQILADKLGFGSKKNDTSVLMKWAEAGFKHKTNNKSQNLVESSASNILEYVRRHLKN